MIYSSTPTSKSFCSFKLCTIYNYHYVGQLKYGCIVVVVVSSGTCGLFMVNG